MVRCNVNLCNIAADGGNLHLNVKLILDVGQGNVNLARAGQISNLLDPGGWDFRNHLHPLARITEQVAHGRRNGKAGLPGSRNDHRNCVLHDIHRYTNGNFSGLLMA